MRTDEILAEVHRNRDELFQACGSDPDQFVRFIQTKEKESKQGVKAAPAREAAMAARPLRALPA